ncbi:MAG: hypothetical protein ISR91_05320 [Candidatus Delongbacteria bacterium]|nr:hypothetical protein [Candidatus Delongbacteria bacterium]
MKKPLLFLLAMIQLLLILSCSLPRDEYRLNIVYTSDTKGFLEDCG